MSVHILATKGSTRGLAGTGWHVMAAFAALRQGGREALRRQRTRKNLAGLDGHLLRDIGLTPTDAEREANKPFWRS